MRKAISKLYDVLLQARKDTTQNVKIKWELESGMGITNENWERICNFHWYSTSSLSWRHHCWKNIIRFFKTPHQIKYKNGTAECWRRCGSEEAHHYHIFWDCPNLKNYWLGIHKTLCEVFKIKFDINFVNLYLGLVAGSVRGGDTKLLQALLAASKKSITRKWLNPTPPTLEDWFNVVFKIFKMERLTFFLKIRKDKFYKIWNEWISFVSPTHPEFR